MVGMEVGGRRVWVAVGIRYKVGVELGVGVSVLVPVGVIVGVGETVGEPVGSLGSNGVVVARSGISSCFTCAVAPVIGTSFVWVGWTRVGTSLWPPKRNEPPGEDTNTMTTPMSTEASSVPRAIIF
ncbi:MAG: hypothetical protein ACXACH_07330 [Candidatus Hermodarchaeia archaeon]